MKMMKTVERKKRKSNKKIKHQSLQAKIINLSHKITVNNNITMMKMMNNKKTAILEKR